MTENICKVTNNRFIFKIHKQLRAVQYKKTNNPIKKWAEDLNKHFFREDVDGQEAHERTLNLNIHYRVM